MKSEAKPGPDGGRYGPECYKKVMNEYLEDPLFGQGVEEKGVDPWDNGSASELRLDDEGLM